MKKYSIYILLVFVIGLNACEEKMVIIPEYKPPVTEKIILVEELTGVQCSQCPAGTTALETIMEQNNGQVIAVAVHGPLLSDLINEDSKDLRSQVAIDIENSFDFLGKPAAIFNRVRFDNQSFIGVTSPSTWGEYISLEFERDFEMLITPVVEYDEVTRTINLEVFVKGFKNVTGNFNISVMVTQSHIISPQYYPDHTDYEYEHNHVLRDMMTGTFGDAAFTSLDVDEIVSFPYSYSIPENGEDVDWVPEDLEVVAFISNTDPADARVNQAASAHVIE